MERFDTRQGHFTSTEEAYPTEGILMGGALAETATSAGAIILAILALVGLLPEALLAVSTIVIGGAFLMASGSIASRFNWIVAQMTGKSAETAEMALGMTVEFLGGVAGIVLGVLSLLGLIPFILLPIAAIVFGFTLLFGIAAKTRLNELEAQCGAAHGTVRGAVREAVSAASGIQIMFGLAAVTLGIVALVGFVPLTLTLVAMLSVGGATLFAGTAMSARVWGFSTFCEMPGAPVTT